MKIKITESSEFQIEVDIIAACVLETVVDQVVLKDKAFPRAKIIALPRLAFSLEAPCAPFLFPSLSLLFQIICNLKRQHSYL